MADIIKIQFHRNVSRSVTIDEGLRHTTVRSDPGDLISIAQVLHGAGFSTEEPTILYTVVPRQSLKDALALLENTADD